MTRKEKAALDELVWELSGPHTLAEIADHLGMSRRSVARIEAEAMATLRAFAPEDWADGLGGEQRGDERSMHGQGRHDYD